MSQTRLKFRRGDSHGAHSSSALPCNGQSSLPLPRPFFKSKRYWQLIFSVFKTLTDQTVIVELKNDLLITGVLKSVDQSVSRSLYLPQRILPLSGSLTADGIVF